VPARVYNRGAGKCSDLGQWMKPVKRHEPKAKAKSDAINLYWVTTDDHDEDWFILAKRGASVTDLERDQIGKAASYGNAGSIAPGHPPINKPGRVRQALKSPPSSAPPCVRRPPIRPSAREAALVFSPYLHGKAHGIFHANPWTPSATSAASAAKLPLHC